MKQVLILFGNKKWENPAFTLSETKTYQHCYEYLYSLAGENGIKMFRASTAWYDEKEKKFKHAWTFENGNWERVANIKPDLIYDKTKLTPKSHYFKQLLANDFPILNDLSFTLLLDNKFFTSLIFPEYSKKHYLIKNLAELKIAASKIKGDKLVLKKASGSGGKEVQIIEKNELETIKDFSDLTVQEFIDGSSGITGLVEENHDLRLVFLNNELIYSYLRIPCKGSFLANLSQGGTMKTLEEKDLPRSLEPLIKKVQETFDSFNPKVYTIDLMFDKEQRPWIIELNSMPGLYFSPEQKIHMNNMYLKLVNLFNSMVN